MIVGIEKGEVCTIPIPAEKIEEEEEEEEEHHERQKEKIINATPVSHGDFHSGAVKFLCEIPGTNKFCSAGEDGKLYVWD